jgi:antibiotic biosynthesis monooxygenase (ABM) superfamily enzyme
MWILYTVLIVGFEVTADKIQPPNWKTMCVLELAFHIFMATQHSSLLAYIPNTSNILYSTVILTTLA